MKLKYKISLIIIIVAFCILFNSIAQASYIDLSDYSNHIQENCSYMVIHTIDNDDFYLLTVDIDFRYFGIYESQKKYGNVIDKNSYISEIVQRRGFNVYKLDKTTYKFTLFKTIKLFESFSPNEDFEVIGCNRAVRKDTYETAPIYKDVTPLPLDYTTPLPTLKWNFDRRVNTIIMSSQNFSMEDIQKYKIYYTTDSRAINNYKNLPCLSIGSIKKDEITNYFYFLTFDNYTTTDITYFFILEEIKTERILSSSFKIKFRELNNYFDKEINDSLKDNGFSNGTQFTNGIPTLNMQYKRSRTDEENYYYEIYSQYFSKSEVIDMYTAYYTNDTNKLDNYSSWEHLSIATFNNTKTGQINYYYFFTLPTEFEETTYYFVLYNKKTGQYGAPSSLKLKPNKMWEYSENIDNDNNIVNSRFDNFINNLKYKLGFLFYPFELISEIFNRFSNINWEEPILTIPAMKVPIFGFHVTNEIHYNFNNLLTIPTVKYIHSVYLVVANVIIIYYLLQFAIKVFEGVLNND